MLLLRGNSFKIEQTACCSNVSLARGHFGGAPTAFRRCCAMCCLGTVDSATDNSGCAGVPGRASAARAAMQLQWNNIVSVVIVFLFL